MKFYKNARKKQVLLMDEEETRYLARMISGAALEEKRIFFPVLCKIKEMGLF